MENFNLKNDVCRAVMKAFSDEVALKMWQDPENASKLVDLPTHVTDGVNWTMFIRDAVDDGRKQ